MFYLPLIGAVALLGYLVWRYRWRLDGLRTLSPSKLTNGTPSPGLNPISGNISPELQASNDISNLDQPLPVDLDEYVEEDRRILQEYAWASYKGLPPAMKQGLELIVLKSLLSKYGGVSYDACSTCLLNHDDIRALLLKGWENGTFDALRSNSAFQALSHKSNTMTPCDREPKDDEKPGTTEENPIVLSAATAGEVLDHTSVAKWSVTGGRDHEINGEDGKENQSIRIEHLSTSGISQGAKNIMLDIQASSFVAGGDIYNVAGDLWRTTYSSNDDRMMAEWYFSVDYRATHNEVARIRSKNTGGWFLRSETYGEWCTSPQRRIMWCPGIPGVGKTVMASLVVDHLRTLDESQAFVGIIYFSYKLRSHQSKLAILEALCRQMFELCQQSAFKDLYNSHAKWRSRPTEAELRSALSTAILGYQHCYLVLDALDEYSAHYSDKQVSEIIETILSLGENVKLLVTSRVLGEMKATFEELGASREDIIADDNDMTTYLVERFTSLRSKLDFEVSDEFSKHVVEKVVEAAKGRFLVAELGMNLLAEQLNLGDLEDALENLPNEIDETYTRVMELIKNYSGSRRELAMKALMWVAYARRRLSVRELQHALATKHGKKEADKYVTPLSTITGLCAGLIIVEDNRWGQSDDERTVRFIHFTTQEFFGKFQTKYFINAHKEMYSTCLEYFSIMGNYIPSYTWIPTRFSSYEKARLPFFDYAALNRGYHANTHHESPPERVLEFLLRNDRPALLSCNYMLNEWCNDSVVEKDGLGIFLAASHDQVDGISVLLDRMDCIPHTGRQRTPLHIATIIGRPNAVQAMLQWSRSSYSDSGQAISSGSDISTGFRICQCGEHGVFLENIRDGYGRTSISYAARFGRDSIAKFLIDHPGVEVDSKDIYRRTPLSYAAGCGSVSIVKLLLEHGGVEVNSKNNYGRTPFSYAAACDSESVVKLFLEHGGVEVDSRDNQGRTPLSGAASTGSESTIKLLLEHEGVEVDSKDNYGRTPFSYAVKCGSESKVKLFLEHGCVDVDAKDDQGRTPFSHAAQVGWGSVIKLLLEHGGIELDSKDKGGRTPFSYAAGDGRASTIKLLLDYGGVEINSKDNQGRTPFSYAAEKCQESVIKVLLEHEGTQVETQDNGGRSALAWASGGRGYRPESALLDTIRLLLTQEVVNVNLADNKGRTALYYAKQGVKEFGRRHQCVVDLLEANGAVELPSTSVDEVASICISE